MYKQIKTGNLKFSKRFTAEAKSLIEVEFNFCELK